MKTGESDKMRYECSW